MNTFLEDEIYLCTSDNQRNIWRRNVRDENHQKRSLAKFVGGYIPYYYRDPSKIAENFNEQLDALNSMADMCRKLPTTEHFRCSHFGEILAGVYIKEVLGYKTLFRKLTQLTAENTNVHKMDVMCVDTNKSPYKYMWYEVKTSRQTEKVYHRHGIYKQMIHSLDKYSQGDKYFDFVQIKDNLSTSDFSEIERKQIRKDLIPPGPGISYHGMAIINISTIDEKDDEFLLSEQGLINFDVRILALTDLKALAIEAYDKYEQIRKIAEG